MNTEIPKKRLVGWKQYLQISGKRAALHLTGTTFAGLGLISLLLSLLSFIFGIVAWYGWRHSNWDDEMTSIVQVIGVVWAISTGISVVTWFLSFRLFRAAKRIETVAPITKYNAKHLPEVETLVRGSDRPATAEQSELLRSVRQSPETRPEQLLRAAQESIQDVK